VGSTHRELARHVETAERKAGMERRRGRSGAPSTSTKRVHRESRTHAGRSFAHDHRVLQHSADEHGRWDCRENNLSDRGRMCWRHVKRDDERDIIACAAA